MRCTAVVLREVFKGKAEVFQFLIYLVECPLDFAWCIQNLYAAREGVIAQSKRLLDLHCVVPVGRQDRAPSSKGISLSAKPDGSHFSGCSHGLTGEQRMLWHLLTASPELCLVQHILPTAEPLAAPKSCSASSQPGWLRPVCALTALHSHNSELLQPQAEECRSTACLPPSLPRNNLDQLFLCNILKTCWY